MWYFPGSWHVGTTLQWFLNLWLIWEWWPFSLMDPLDWDDNERRGAGSLFILLILIVAAVVLTLWQSGVL